MVKNFRDKIAVSGVTVLGVGVALLVFTFISAYGFLTKSLEIIASEDLVQTFGEALAPLIATCIRIMYLGVMGWIGSLLTIRGVTIIANAPKTEVAVPQKPLVPEKQPAPQQKPQPKPQPKTQPKPQPQPEEAEPEAGPEAKPEPKPSEPEFIVIPLDEIEQEEPKPQEIQSSS